MMIGTTAYGVKVLMADCPDAFAEAIEYTLDEVAARLALPLSLTRNRATGPFDLSYGHTNDKPGVPVVPFDDRCYIPTARFVAQGEPPLWVPEGWPSATRPDLIGGVFRLLTSLDEHHVADSARDQRGIFATDALPDQRRRHLATTLVENHVAAIRRLLEQRRLPSPLPRWPGGCRWALMVTHDTDAVRLSALPEMIFNGAKAVLRRDCTRLRMLKDGLRHLRTPLEQNPLYGFSRWKASLETIGVRSAFCLYVRRKVRPRLNDCRSSVADRRVDWRQLRGIADAGWEFGLHPPIGAKDSIDEFLSVKRFLEDRLERPVYGLRHHYWALDWRAPHQTYRKHVETGFRYDLSIAWRDAPGFRAGTCLPFRPWDPQRKRGLDLYAVPTAIMDGHVIQAMGDADATSRALAVLKTIRDAGGVAVLDWHTEARRRLSTISVTRVTVRTSRRSSHTHWWTKRCGSQRPGSSSNIGTGGGRLFSEAHG